MTATPIHDQLRHEYAVKAVADAPQDPEGHRLVLEIHEAKFRQLEADGKDARWFGLPWLMAGRG